MKKISTILNKLLLTLGLGIFCSINGLYSQCVDNSNYWIESWKSCSTSPNPNPARAASNWLLFEFDEAQAIATTHIWNANKIDESGLGAKEVFIDVSIDGDTWTQVGTDKFTWPKGTEALDYDGFEGPDLSNFGFIHKVLVTVINNYDDSDCVSIAEFKFDINPDACYGIEDECGVCDGPGIITWYQDTDADGLGDPDASIQNCEQPQGYVDNDDDPCDNGLFGWPDMEVLFYENGCTNCHGTDGDSGLDLTSYEGISAGGNICGDEILSGNTLVNIINEAGYVACSNYTFNRPMNERVGGAIDAEEIIMIQEWIDAGAPVDCACPAGSPDSDNDGVCDNSDDCPNFDNALFGTPCDDGDSCTQNDVYVNSCDCRGTEIPDSDFDGVCDLNDYEPNNPCTADGIIGLPEPSNWIANDANDCDDDGVVLGSGDQDDFDECITQNGTSLAPSCLCPSNSTYSGAKIVKHVGIYEPSISYSEGLPDRNLGSAIGFQDYVDFEFPYMEYGQNICFELGFNSAEGGVKFEINELGSYKYYNRDTTKTDYELQLFCFPSFVAGPQSVRVSRLLTGALKVDGSYVEHCDCTDGDPKKDFTACQCPGEVFEGTGTIVQSGGFNNVENAEGAPDGEFTGWINGDSDSIEISFDELPIHSEICINLSFDRVAGRVSFDLNGDYFEVTNQTGLEDQDRGQDICFLTKTEGPQYLKVKERGSGSIWIDGFYTKSCSTCTEDEDNDNVCDEDDICPGFDDHADDDGDGIPDGCDECDNILINTACNDNDPCTVNDLYDDNCNCAGTFADADNDGVCDEDDVCPDFDNSLIGTSCDDNDPCTTQDVYNTSCNCAGIFADADQDGVCDEDDICPDGDDTIDTDGDGVPDACDECDASLVGTTCNDNDPCTTQDVFDMDCNCAGIFADADEDGVCDEDDICPDGDDTIDTDGDGVPDACDECDASLAGTTCNDNDPCTTQDVFDADCNCEGIFADADEDGVCDEEDICPDGDDSIDTDGDGIPDACDECDATLAGTMCNDNDPCTTQDVFDADCNCEGIFADADDDGVCDEDDTCPDFDNSLIGTACDDGDICTLGETYDQDCGCSGGVFQDLDEDGICDAEDECDAGTAGTACDDNNPCTVQDVYDADCNCSGTFADADEDGVCDEDDLCPDFDNNLIGTPCDDGDICTLGETYDQDCGCSGGVFQDLDEDGICDAEDECDAGTAGTACDDNDPCTVQDIYDADCNCAGTYADADEDGICDEDDLCPDFDNNLIGTPCDDGDICTLGETYDQDCACSGGIFQDMDNDGICDAEDECDASTVGTACDDNDACTAQDVYDADCNCVGTFQDEDLDGVCDEDDLCPGGDDTIDTDGDGIPDYCDECDASLNGSACDDDDECTLNDLFDEDCNCIGTYTDEDEDGVCDAEDICPGGDDNLDEDEDGIPDHCDDCNDTLIGNACDDGDECTENDVYLEDCTCQGISEDSDNDGVCNALDACPGYDDNIDEDEDGIPDDCDDCIDELTNLPINVLQHSGLGTAYLGVTLGNKLNPSFTIKDINAKTQGEEDELFIDIVEVSYTETSGEAKFYGTYRGDEIDSIQVNLVGNINSINVGLKDGYDGEADNLEISISDITTCKFDEITSTFNPQKEELEFLVYPNPTLGDFSVEFSTTNVDDYSINLSDVYGVKHYFKSFEGLGNKRTINIHGLDLGQGIYFVTVQQGNHKMTKKIVILKQ